MELWPEIIKNVIVVFFGILQVAIIALMAGAFKLYCDVLKLKKDMSFAFCKIRTLENNKKE